MVFFVFHLLFKYLQIYTKIKINNLKGNLNYLCRQLYWSLDNKVNAPKHAFPEYIYIYFHAYIRLSCFIDFCDKLLK